MTKKILTLYFISALLGILTGIIASLFQLSISWIDSSLQVVLVFLQQQGWPVTWCSAFISMLMVLVAWLLVFFLAPEASGSGVPEIEGALLHKRPIYWHRLIPVKFFAGILALSAKMVMGREGPTIQMGGNIGKMLGDVLSVSSHRRDTLIAAGSAAGLAAAFNAPLAGVLFVMEEMRNQFNYSFLNFKMVIICCVTATITMQYFLGSGPAISMQIFPLPSLNSLGYFLLFGCLMGLTGLLFNKTLVFFLDFVGKLNPQKKLIYVLIVGGAVGYLAVAYPGTVGGGYEIIAQSLHLTYGVKALLLLLISRFFFTFFSYSTGVPGGIFAPMLALGTLLGLATFEMIHFFLPDLDIYPGMFAVAGMGALFAASVRSPITGVILVVEMTQNYSLILPLMLTCITSTTVMQISKNAPIYTQLLRRKLLKKQ